MLIFTVLEDRVELYPEHLGQNLQHRLDHLKLKAYYLFDKFVYKGAIKTPCYLIYDGGSTYIDLEAGQRHMKRFPKGSYELFVFKQDSES